MPGPRGHLGRRYPAVEPRRHRRVPQVVRSASQRRGRLLRAQRDSTGDRPAPALQALRERPTPHTAEQPAIRRGPVLVEVLTQERGQLRGRRHHGATTLPAFNALTDLLATERPEPLRAVAIPMHSRPCRMLTRRPCQGSGETGSSSSSQVTANTAESVSRGSRRRLRRRAWPAPPTHSLHLRPGRGRRDRRIRPLHHRERAYSHGADPQRDQRSARRQEPGRCPDPAQLRDQGGVAVRR